MPLLHVYNPDTDYALAAGSHNYTPPEAIRRIRARNALLPLSYMGADDALLVMDADAPLDGNNDARILTPGYLTDWSRFTANPWGWNVTIARYLRKNCPGIKGIPDDASLERLRLLSHRRTSRRFLSMLHMRNVALDIALPEELTDEQDAMEYFMMHGKAFFKAPWSSSGRGILFADDIAPDLVRQWVHGVIAKQGSVMAEPFYPKHLDCATEWSVAPDGSASFTGVSLFEASRRGKYHHNLKGSQMELWNRIGVLDSSLIEAQRDVLQSVAAGSYSGPVGIDMLVLDNGAVHPCVEINFRNTMGSILIDPSDKSLSI